MKFKILLKNNILFTIKDNLYNKTYQMMRKKIKNTINWNKKFRNKKIKYHKLHQNIN